MIAVKKLIVEFRQKMVRGGVELQGIARSGRGTKYILDSVVILNEEGKDYPSKEQIEAGVSKLYDSAE
jgi:hypothetical protein